MNQSEQEFYVAQFDRIRVSGKCTKNTLKNVFDESCYFKFKGKPKLKVKYENLLNRYFDDLAKLKEWNNLL